MNKSYPPQYAYPSAPPVYRVLPNPPRLHWAWVLVLSALTRGLFGAVWMLVQANWVRKVQGRSAAFVWAIVHVALFPFIFVTAIAASIAAAMLHQPIDDVMMPVSVFSVVAVLMLYYITTYMLRAELEQEPIGIPLSGAMTFFFGTTYFQYHLHDFQFSGSYDGSALGIQQGVVPYEQPSSGASPYPPMQS